MSEQERERRNIHSASDLYIDNLEYQGLLKDTAKQTQPYGTVQNGNSNGVVIVTGQNNVLDQDVYVDEAIVVNQNTKVDLAGHNIISTKDNTNVFKVVDGATLTIVDSKADTTNYVAKAEDGTYQIVSAAEANASMTAVKGGIIGGASFVNNEQSGAIYVENGKLDMQGGTLAANTVDTKNKADNAFMAVAGLFGFNNIGNGAASLTVKKGASAVLSDKVNISYNTSESGNWEYLTSAAIYTEGTVESAANITNNAALSQAIAGVGAKDDATFTNRGVISYNDAKDTSVGALAANLSNAEASGIYNFGTIAYNTSADNSVAAVEYYGKFTNGGKIL